MKKRVATLLAIVAMVGCKNQSNNYNKITISGNDSVKNVLVEISYKDTFCFELPNSVSDSLILESIRIAGDSLKKDSMRRDSLHRINFRRITKIINGGNNGYADREKLWIKAKEVLK